MMSPGHLGIKIVEYVLDPQSLGSEEPAQTCPTFSSKKSFVIPELHSQVQPVGELGTFSTSLLYG